MKHCLLAAAMFGAAAGCAAAQGLGAAGAITGTVVAPTGAVIAGASVDLQNTNTHFERAVRTDAQGAFRYSNLAPFPYHLTVSAPGFQSHTIDVSVAGTVPIVVSVRLQLAGAATTLNVSE